MSDGNWSSSVYGYPAQFGSPLAERKSLNGLTVALTVLLSIMALACALSAPALFFRSGIFANAADGRFAKEEQASLADAAVFATAAVILVLYVPIGIVFIIWQYRHAKNAWLLAPRGLAPGWAIGGWFIPIANLVLPAVQLHHSSRASTSRINARRSALAIIVPWALVLALGGITSTVAVSISPELIESTSDLEAAARSDWIEGISSAVLVVAALLCIAMVRTLSKRQGQAFDVWQAELYGRQRRSLIRPATHPLQAMPPPSATTPRAGRRRRPAHRRDRHVPEGSPGYQWLAQPVQQDAPWNASDPRTSPARDLSEPGAPQADWTDPWRQPPGRP
jgi:hypothetical protein